MKQQDKRILAGVGCLVLFAFVFVAFVVIWGLRHPSAPAQPDGRSRT